MPLTHREAYESGNGRLAEQSEDELAFIVDGDPDPAVDDADNPLVMLADVAGWAGQTYNGNPLTEIAYDRLYAGGWHVRLQYGTQQRQTGESTFTFNTAGGTQHTTVARSHVQTYNSSGGHIATAMDGFLNIDEAYNPSGLDVPTAAFAFQVTLYAAPSVVTPSFVALLYHLTDCVNNNPFTASADGVSLTFAAGECRFDGATGAKRGYGDWELTLNFSAMPNETNLTVGTAPNAITGISKDGWDYLSVRFKKVKNAGDTFIAPAPQFVFVDRVFDRQNFTGLIPTLPSSPFGGGGLFPTGS